MKLLFLYASNNRAIALETQIFQLIRLGHQVEVLTLAIPGPFHEFLSGRGVKVASLKITASSKPWRYFLWARILHAYLKKSEINHIFAHLQPASLVAVMAKFFSFTDDLYVVSFRHHQDSTNIGSWSGDKLIEILSDKIIAPCAIVRSKVTSSFVSCDKKTAILPYSYDFDAYPKPSGAISGDPFFARFREHLKFCLVSRIVAEKRHLLALDAFARLAAKNSNTCLFLLGDGPESAPLHEFIDKYSLVDRVFFLGHRSDVVDILDYCDVVLHPSRAEASCSVVKEAGLVCKPVIACSGVGDFDEYLVNKINSLVLPISAGASDWASAMAILASNSNLRKRLGSALRDTVLEHFSDNDESLRRLDSLCSNIAKSR